VFKTLLEEDKEESTSEDDNSDLINMGSPRRLNRPSLSLNGAIEEMGSREESPENPENLVTDITN